MKKIIKIILPILILFILGSACYLGINELFAKNTEIEFSVKSGESAYSVIENLKQSGTIKSELVMKIFYKNAAKNDDFSIKSGKTTLRPNMSYSEILNALNSSMKTSDYVLTVPGGYELVQIAALCEEKLGILSDEFLLEAQTGEFDYTFLPSAGVENRLEGYLFPETYFFKKGVTPHEIIETMLAQFDSVYTDEYKLRAKELGLTDHEILILASVIEKESSSDREKVSSVFHNRLNSPRFSYLESCATVIYVTKQPKDRLTLEDTRINSPYNTYINKGLPPGPICSPGKESIHAALYPETTDYYYFSALDNGTNTFSKTYEEHLEKNR